MIDPITSPLRIIDDVYFQCKTDDTEGFFKSVEERFRSILAAHSAQVRFENQVFNKS